MDDQQSSQDSGDSQQENKNQPDNQPNHSYNNDNTTAHSSKPRKLWLVLFILIMAAIGAGIWYIVANKSDDTNKQDAKAAVSLDSKFCYIRLAHLVCTDTEGKNPVRYDLPTIDGKTITSITPSHKGGSFVAVSSIDSAGSAKIAILGEDMKVTKQLKFAEGVTAQDPTFSNDDKSVLLEITGPNTDRQIYKYDLATDKTTKLTSKGANTQPKQTADGRISYTYYDNQGNWMAQVMNSDGSNVKALPKVLKTNATYFEYHAQTGNVFLYSKRGADDRVAYGKLDDVLANKNIKYLDAKITSSGERVVYVDVNTVFITKYDVTADGSFWDLKTGTKKTTISKIDSPVGAITADFAKLTKSAQQAEVPHDRITGLNTAPADFKPYITKVFDEVDAACKADVSGSELYIDIKQVVRDSYVYTTQGCDGGAAVYYAKVDNKWVQAFRTQQGVGCKVINQYKIPKSMIAECYDDSKGEDGTTVIANKNE